MARSWRAPDDYIIDFLFFEKVTGMHSGKQDSGRPAHITWFDAKALRWIEIDLDFQCRFINGQEHPRVGDTANTCQALAQLFCFRAQHRLILAIEAHSHIEVGGSLRFAEPLLHEGAYFAFQAGITVYHCFHGSHCGFIVGVRRDADPDFRSIDVTNFITKHRPSNVCSHIVDAWDAPQFGADSGNDATHFCIGRTRCTFKPHH